MACMKHTKNCSNSGNKKDSSKKLPPVRPVFDASCKMGRHPSLNECLEKGPNVIELLVAVFIRFRLGPIGVISDIRKAFQMIAVQNKDQDYLLFLWWEHLSSEKVKIFRHKRVVFGLVCSPFILGAVINNHLDNVNNDDKAVALKLKKSLYVDNSVTSVNSMEEYEDFKSRAVRILADTKLELRQWELGGVLGSHLEQNFKDSDDDNFARYSLPKITEQPDETVTSVLGMKWDKQRDLISCGSFPTMPENVTKRSLLAAINKIFDPLGILSPAMVYPKILLQSTWIKKMDWDEELATEIVSKFKKWMMELDYLKRVKVPRFLKGQSFTHLSEQLHIFCDASEVAYAAEVFLRVENEEGVSVQLIQAKARVSPTKKITIPRLELMACTIAARLGNSVKEILEYEIQTFFWSDSTTALAWIQRNDEWGTFVGNRVREIVKLSSADEWRHVAGKLNPADFPSRGSSPKDLFESIWWEGPQWLKLTSTE